MELLQYVIEDSTIAKLLGIQNFNNDESAVLELVKNAYDAKAPTLTLEFNDNELIISDDGSGMDANDIKDHWMHVGKSSKEYEVFDSNNRKRILAGSKGVGRFALSRLGTGASIYTKKKDCTGVVWKTDWNRSTLEEDVSLEESGTKIVISNLREKWGKKKALDLVEFLEKTYNDDSMEIKVIHPDVTKIIPKHFPKPEVGENCLSHIELKYDKKNKILYTTVSSDEFMDEAKRYCQDINLKQYFIETDMVAELKNSKEFELSQEELPGYLGKIGDFSAQFYFKCFINKSRS